MALPYNEGMSAFRRKAPSEMALFFHSLGALFGIGVVVFAISQLFLGPRSAFLLGGVTGAIALALLLHLYGMERVRQERRRLTRRERAGSCVAAVAFSAIAIAVYLMPPSLRLTEDSTVGKCVLIVSIPLAFTLFVRAAFGYDSTDSN